MKRNKHFATIIAVSNTLIEWVEYSFFLYFSPLIATLFFPNSSAQTGLLLTYSVFAISYIIRPASGIVFGYLSDKYGRKPPMIIAMFLMGFATLGIGLLPTYDTIGIVAPILLLVLRSLQSASVSGELQSSAVYLIEHAREHKVFSGSLILAGASGGMFIGGLIASVLSKQCAYESLWRWPFIITGIITFVFCILRRKLQETPVFINNLRQSQLADNPAMRIIEYKNALFKIIVVSAFVCSFVYVCNGYYSHYLSEFSSYTLSQAQLLCSMTELVVFILAPIIAITLNDETYLPVLKLGLIGISINAPLQFISASIDNHAGIRLSLMFYALFDSLVTATVAYYLYNQLPSTLRCTGLGLGWNIAAALFGGISPILAAQLVHSGYVYLPGFIVSIIGLLALRAISHPLLQTHFTTHYP